MMLRNLLFSTAKIKSCHFPSHSLPEENDETMSKSNTEDPLPDPDLTPNASSNALPSDLGLPGKNLSPSRLDPFYDVCSSVSSRAQPSYGPYQPPLGLPVGYSPQTPFPSQAEGSFSTLQPHKEDWPPSNLSSSSFLGAFSNDSHPSCLVSGDYCSYQSKTGSSNFLPDRHSPDLGSLEQPRSLHSISTEPAHHSYYMSSCPCPSHGAPCCGQGPGNIYWTNQRPHHGVQYHTPCLPSCPNSSKPSDQELFHRRTSFPPQPSSVPSTAPLSLEQRKVFVTYKADNEKHVKEVINFVALLRHNGFYTHIDMFEQQFSSISKIDFMERYIHEKDYLIIIIISPKYYEIVTNASLFRENDETMNTVYIHKQLQNEFIQNGCRNFRFIPVLFPGANKCHVPAWLQNTHIFSWPRDRDDILRRLMRVEKYNPPPIGELPTIVSIPI
ncbi:uncharacterized protein traf3ip2l [Trichomycterus rosablanca]|uniref:uncharacterized protein traf3ip2l n=1 Tax=Trichomycterus rosablanca TaxID=2290929 RepID=UPI002F355FBA